MWRGGTWKRENLRLALTDTCKKSSIFLTLSASQTEAVGSKIIWLGLSDFYGALGDLLCLFVFLQYVPKLCTCKSLKEFKK